MQAGESTPFVSPLDSDAGRPKSYLDHLLLPDTVEFETLCLAAIGVADKSTVPAIG